MGSQGVLRCRVWALDGEVLGVESVFFCGCWGLGFRV